MYRTSAWLCRVRASPATMRHSSDFGEGRICRISCHSRTAIRASSTGPLSIGIPPSTGGYVVSTGHTHAAQWGAQSAPTRITHTYTLRTGQKEAQRIAVRPLPVSPPLAGRSRSTPEADSRGSLRADRPCRPHALEKVILQPDTASV